MEEALLVGLAAAFFTTSWVIVKRMAKGRL